MSPVRQPPHRKRPGPPRRGRIVDPDYLAWLHLQEGVIRGGKTHSVHHVRSFGSPKNDRCTLPLEFGYHQIQEGQKSIEALGKAKWQAIHGVDIETAIWKYQQRYLSQHPEIVW